MKRDGRTITVVSAEDELPKILHYRYYRLLSDPKLLQCGSTGRLFTRKDGRVWRHVGYAWEQTRSGNFKIRGL